MFSVNDDILRGRLQRSQKVLACCISLLNCDGCLPVPVGLTGAGDNKKTLDNKGKGTFFPLHIL
jgi:hypothetical protein